jgi:hypothetical protein
VPSPDAVLTNLTATANDWRWLAVTWHVLLAAFLLILIGGWRPSIRLVGQLLVVPILSVSVTAWLSGNPFNGAVFAIFGAVLVTSAVRLSPTAVRIASSAEVALGAVIVVFGWTYPHFVRTDSWTTYLYASPFGILPCPTLSLVIGITLIFPDLQSRSWATTLAVAGLLYGLIGVLRLGVALDWGLLVASAALAGTMLRNARGWRSVRANRTERRGPLPGDDLIAQPLATLTHAITIRRPPDEVWPWLIQMGAGSRAGWYSYDFLDNGGQPSAANLIPELQDIAIGTVFPALPGVTEGFSLLALEPRRSLILGWSSPSGTPLVTWTFVLKDQTDQSTRLIVRARGGQGYRFRGLPSWLSKPIARLVHFVMQREQLLGIARRVESSSEALREVTPSSSVGFRRQSA